MACLILRHPVLYATLLLAVLALLRMWPRGAAPPRPWAGAAIPYQRFPLPRVANASRAVVGLLQGDALQAALAETSRTRDKVAESVLLNVGSDMRAVQFFYPSTMTLVWDWLLPTWPCEHRRRVGKIGDGGKWVCGLQQLAAQAAAGTCVVYSFGVRDDVSFEQELHDLTGCTVHLHDFSIDRVPVGDGRAREGFNFSRVGIGAVAREQPPLRTLSQLMQQNGHTHLSLLKLDVEGAELDALPAILAEFQWKPPFSQLLLEVHHDGDALKVLRTFQALERANLAPFHFEANLAAVAFGVAHPCCVEYSFLSLGGDADAD